MQSSQAKVEFNSVKNEEGYQAKNRALAIYRQNTKMMMSL